MKKFVFKIRNVIDFSNVLQSVQSSVDNSNFFLGAVVYNRNNTRRYIHLPGIYQNSTVCVAYRGVREMKRSPEFVVKQKRRISTSKYAYENAIAITSCRVENYYVSIK